MLCWHGYVIKENQCSMWHYGMTQCQHGNNDNVMRASAWFKFFDGSHDIWKGKVTIRSEI